MLQLLWVPNVPLGWILIALAPYTPMPAFVRKFKEADNKLRKYQMEILQHLRNKHKEGSFRMNSFGKLLIEFAEQENLPLRDLLSEVLIFLIAGQRSSY